MYYIFQGLLVFILGIVFSIGIGSQISNKSFEPIILIAILYCAAIITGCSLAILDSLKELKNSFQKNDNSS